MGPFEAEFCCSQHATAVALAHDSKDDRLPFLPVKQPIPNVLLYDDLQDNIQSVFMER